MPQVDDDVRQKEERLRVGLCLYGFIQYGMLAGQIFTILLLP